MPICFLTLTVAGGHFSHHQMHWVISAANKVQAQDGIPKVVQNRHTVPSLALMYTSLTNDYSCYLKVIF